MSVYSGFTYRLQETSYNKTVYNLMCLLQLKVAAALRGENFNNLAFEKYFTKFYYKLTQMEKSKHHPPIFSCSLKELACFFGIFETQPQDNLSSVSSTSYISVSKFKTISHPIEHNTTIITGATGLSSVVKIKSKEVLPKRNLSRTQAYKKNQVRSFSQKPFPRQPLPKVESPSCHNDYGNKFQQIHKRPEQRMKTANSQNTRSISPTNYYQQKKTILNTIYSTSFKRQFNERIQPRNSHLNHTTPDLPSFRPKR